MALADSSIASLKNRALAPRKGAMTAGKSKMNEILTCGRRRYRIDEIDETKNTCRVMIDHRWLGWCKIGDSIVACKSMRFAKIYA